MGSEVAFVNRRQFLLGGGAAIACGPAANARPSAWISRTGNVGYRTHGKNGVWLMAAVPGKDQILAGVEHGGLWSSMNGGITWSELSADKPINNIPSQIVFDPKNPSVFWVAGIYGTGIYKTTDGGITFEALQHEPCDGLGIDFSDPDRRTLITAFHERPNTLTMSVTSGRSWHPLTAPAGDSFDSNPCIVGDNTFVVGSRAGIYRTDDAGRSWSQVSAVRPYRNHPIDMPVRSSDGAIFWYADSGGLLRSTDTGKSWDLLRVPLTAPPAEAQAGMLCGVGGQRLYLSRDRGVNWAPFGPPIPARPHGVIYASARRTYFVWSHTTPLGPASILSWTPG